MSPEEEIKDFAIKNGALVCGIASASEIDAEAPEGHRPSDLLLGARSVIVVGRLPLSGAFRCRDYRLAAEMAFQSNEEIYRVAYRLVDFIEHRYGYECLFPPPDSMGSWDPQLSIKLCAEKAGLGTRSLAGEMILHPKYGFLYLAVVITTMPLRPDGPLSEPVCPAPSCVRMYERYGTTPCMRACPECLSGVIENGRIKNSRYDRVLCGVRAQTTSPVGFQKMLLEVINEEDKERRKMMLLGDFMSRTIKSLAFRTNLDATCLECWRVCPVGMQYRFLR